MPKIPESRYRKKKKKADCVSDMLVRANALSNDSVQQTSKSLTNAVRSKERLRLLLIKTTKRGTPILPAQLLQSIPLQDLVAQLRHLRLQLSNTSAAMGDLVWQLESRGISNGKRLCDPDNDIPF